MYIPCQIVDTSSLESQASSSIHLKGLCCPCLSSHRSSNEAHASNEATQQITEDPELVFSRHRAAVIAGHRFMVNNAANWNLQNMAPPLPQMGPPPLPPRKLSSFFPPMEPIPSRKNSRESDEATVPVPVTSTAVPTPLKRVHKEKQSRRISSPGIVSPTPLPTLSELNEGRALATNQAHNLRSSAAKIACPYLSPIDVAATSWEWDFGNNETLRSHNIPGAHSPEDHESGATDRVNIWGDPPVVNKGLLMQQREKMWSRWKERYFILTRDYLHCFRRLRNVYRLHITLSAMGQFIYKLRLANVEDIKWDTRRNVSRICLTIRHEPTILLRSSENDNNDALYHWYSLLQECICMSKIRRQAIRVFNSSSEEDTNSSNSHSAAIIVNEDSNSHNSSYTIGTSSGTSGESSSQMDILEIYRRRCGGGRQSIIPSISSNSNVGSTAPLPNPPPPPPNQRRASVVSSSSCGFYLHEPHTRPPSILSSRAPSNLFKRFQLPALDSESEVDDRELHDILEGLPQRCTNPTREIDVSSHTDSHPSSVQQPQRILRKEAPSPIYDTNNNDDDEELDEIDDFISPTAKNPSRCESRMTLREFVKTPWRPSSCLPTPPDSKMMRELRESSSSRLSAFPIPARRPLVPQRPMSSFSRPPPHLVFGGRKVLPTPWTKNPTLQIGKGAAFSRSNVIVCPSTLSADVTYLRRV